MPLASLLDRFRRPKADPEAAARVKEWAGALVAEPGAAFSVNEIVCADPSCPGTETVVLVMIPGRRTRAVKVGKALDQVTEQDLREALLKP